MLPYRRARAILHTVEEHYWYAGPVSEKKAEDVLTLPHHRPGQFLVRDSLLPDCDFYLSVLGRLGVCVNHYPITLGMDCSCNINGYTFEDIPSCVKFYTENRIGGVFLRLPKMSILNDSQVPCPSKQPLIKVASTQKCSEGATASASLVPVATMSTKFTRTRDTTYATVYDDVESVYATQLIGPEEEHMYDVVHMGVVENSSKQCEEAKREVAGSTTSEDEFCTAMSLTRIIETVTGEVYTVPNTAMKPLAKKHLVLTPCGQSHTPPRSRLTPKYCSTLRDEEEVRNSCEKSPKQIIKTSPKQFCIHNEVVTLPSLQLRKELLFGDSKPPSSVLKKLAPSAQSTRVGDIKREGEGRIPIRRGSAGDIPLTGSAFNAKKSIPTAVVASFIKEASPPLPTPIYEEAEQQQEISYGHKVPHIPRDKKDQLRAVKSSPAVLITTEPSLSTPQKEKAKKKNKLKSFFKFKQKASAGKP